ncbi:MAG TPA: lysophospholipid acyltransferase family protein [Burkholderiaceae bacterium]|nr:lysophospholipid acyltransferase family protein [Burkholderiaceae bacterium]
MVIGFLIWLVYRPLSFTWRITSREPQSMLDALRERRPFVVAHWHGDLFALAWLARRYRLVTIASRSKDGRIMGTLLRLLGVRVSAGSSSRGGAAALKGLIRQMREGYNCSFAVDGPRGPIYKLKPGVLETSRVVHCPIYYVSVSCDRAYHWHRSWDRAYIPKPFARIEVQWRGPLPALGRHDDARDPQALARLEELMLQAKRDSRVPGQQDLP